MYDMWDMKPVYIFLEDENKDSYPLPHADINIKWQRKGRCGSLEFTYLGGDFFWADPKVKNGDVITMKYGQGTDPELIFWGRVHTVNTNNGVIKVTAFDALRGLMSKDYRMFRDQTATGITQTYIADYVLSVGILADTVHVLPKVDGDSKAALNVITEALEDTTKATKELFFLHCVGEYITLSNIKDCALELPITGEDLLYGYDHSLDIDSDTYNRVVLMQEDKKDQKDKKNKKKKLFVAEDEANINRWGALQYFAKCDGNEAQVAEMAKTLLALKNRELESLKLSCIGDFRCKPGYSVIIHIPELGIEDRFVIEEATHKVDGNAHTMDLKVVNYDVLSHRKSG